MTADDQLEETSGWDDWARPENAFAVLLLTACPVLVLALGVWFVARALGT